MQEKKLKPLVLSLLFSAGLNVALLSALVATLAQGSNPSEKIAKRQSIGSLKPNNQSQLAAYSKMSFRELASLLTNRDLVEEGYLKRDLALSALVKVHHFNLEKALSSNDLQKHKVDEIDLFPGLGDEQFEAILRFAYQDKWPLTARGIFELLKKSSIPRDPTLEQAFCLTHEFHVLQTLFQKTGFAADPVDLINLAVEGSFDLFSQFIKEQTLLPDYSIEKRRRFLLGCLIQESKSAAELIVKTDFDFALKTLDDKALAHLLSKLSSPHVENVRFCKAVLDASRSDFILEAAVKKLYFFAHENPPEPLSLQSAIVRFKGGKYSVAVEKPKALYHVVKEKESLWKIAKQYQVKVDDIVQLNGIDKDKLRPGMELKIPN